MASLTDCSCEPDIIVVDCFADPDFDDHENDSDQLHRYANGGTASLFVMGGAVNESISVASSDESIFVVERAAYSRSERFLASDLEVLRVELRGVGSGEAELMLGNADGPLASRTLSFVDVHRVVLTALRGLPPALEPPVDTSALALGGDGGAFRLHYGDDLGDDIEGNGVFTLADEIVDAEVPVAVVWEDAEGGVYRNPKREVLYVSPVVEETRLSFSLVGVPSNDDIVVVPANVGRNVVRAHLTTKAEVRDALAERGVELTPQLEPLFDDSDDERVFCDRDVCAAKLVVEDALGRTVYGAGSSWADGDEVLLSRGDTVMFSRGNDERTLHARVGGLRESVVVWADSGTIEVRGTPDPVYCGSIGRGGASLTMLGLLLLRRRRFSRASAFVRRGCFAARQAKQAQRSQA